MSSVSKYRGPANSALGPEVGAWGRVDARSGPRLENFYDVTTAEQLKWGWQGAAQWLVLPNHARCVFPNIIDLQPRSAGRP